MDNLNLIAIKKNVALIKEDGKYYTVLIGFHSEHGKIAYDFKYTDAQENIIVAMKQFLYYVDIRTRQAQKLVEDIEDYINEPGGEEFLKMYPYWTRKKLYNLKTGLPFWTKTINDEYISTIYKEEKNE